MIKLSKDEVTNLYVQLECRFKEIKENIKSIDKIILDTKENNQFLVKSNKINFRNDSFKINDSQKIDNNSKLTVQGELNNNNLSPHQSQLGNSHYENKSRKNSSHRQSNFNIETYPMEVNDLNTENEIHTEQNKIENHKNSSEKLQSQGTFFENDSTTINNSNKNIIKLSPINEVYDSKMKNNVKFNSCYDDNEADKTNQKPIQKKQLSQNTQSVKDTQYQQNNILNKEKNHDDTSKILNDSDEKDTTSINLDNSFTLDDKNNVNQTSQENHDKKKKSNLKSNQFSKSNVIHNNNFSKQPSNEFVKFGLRKNIRNKIKKKRDSTTENILKYNKVNLVQDKMKNQMKNFLQDNIKESNMFDNDDAFEFDATFVKNENHINPKFMDIDIDLIDNPRKTMDSEFDDNRMSLINLSLSNKTSLKAKYLKSEYRKQQEKILNYRIDKYSDTLIMKETDAAMYLNIIKQREFHQISEGSLFIYFWNLFITLIIMFQIITFPIETFSELWIQNDPNYINIQMQFEYIFMVDILINFLTSQRDKYGHHVKKISEISISYLQSWFVLDVISSVPITNLEQYNLIDSNSNQNVQLKMLKMPRYLRVIKGFLNIFYSRMTKAIDIDNIVNLSSSDKARYLNLFRYLIQFGVISHILACYLIYLVQPCPDTEHCANWFYSFMIDEYESMIANHELSALGDAAYQFRNNQGSEGVVHYQNFILSDHRFQVQCDAWYFVIQTVTTVGYGDVISNTTNERVFRAFCMMVGSVMFSLLSSHVMEFCISETLNIQKQNEHEVMIEKLQMKQDITGDSKRFLHLLGDSVYTESLKNELDFTKLLPHDMCQSVLNFMWHVQMNKLMILNDESMGFFVMMMKISKFRRCVYEEIVGIEGKYINLLYSGRVGILIPNLNDQLGQDQLYNLYIGSEIGQNHQINFNAGQNNNQVQQCTVNCELVQIESKDFLKLMTQSLKGLEQVQLNLLDYLVELYLIVSLQFCMMKMGLQVEQNWQSNVTSILQFNETDFIVLNRIFENYKNNTSRNLDSRIVAKQTNDGKDTKWFLNIIDNEIQKHVNHKARGLVRVLVSNDFILLKEYISMFKSKDLKVKTVSKNKSLSKQL